MGLHQRAHPLCRDHRQEPSPAQLLVRVQQTVDPSPNGERCLPVDRMRVAHAKIGEEWERSMSDGDRDLEDRLRWLVIEGRKRHWTLDMASELTTKAPALLDLIELLKRRQGSGS